MPSKEHECSSNSPAEVEASSSTSTVIRELSTQFESSANASGPSEVLSGLSGFSSSIQRVKGFVEEHAGERDALLGTLTTVGYASISAAAGGSMASGGLPPFNNAEGNSKPRNASVRMVVLAVSFVFTLFGSTLLGALVQPYLSSDTSNPIVRDRIRREWTEELKRHTTWLEMVETQRVRWIQESNEHEVLRQKMNREFENWARAREDWTLEKAGWEKESESERERRRKEREIEEEKEKEYRERAGILWSNLQQDSHCLRYGTRKYSAKLEHVPESYNAIKACRQTPIAIHGREILPTHCEHQANGTWGVWHIDFNEAWCRTWWSHFNDTGCTTEGSGLRRIEAQLENLHAGDDEKEMCGTTPARFYGLRFDGAIGCSDWDKPQPVGFWDIEDKECLNHSP